MNSNLEQLAREESRRLGILDTEVQRLKAEVSFEEKRKFEINKGNQEIKAKMDGL